MPSNRLLLGLAAIVLALAGCASAAEERSLFVLLTDNRLLRVAEDGEVLSQVRLGADPESASWGSLLAATADGGVYALVRGVRQRVAVIDSAGVVVRTYALPRESTWRRIAVGPKSGRVYVVGDVEGTRKNDLGQPELGVRLLVLAPDGRRVALEPIREPDGRDWYAGWITLAPDETSLLIAYHGSDTTGSDLVRLDPIRTCVDDTPEWAACLAVNHGRAQWAGDTVVAATGEAWLAVLEPSGRLVRKLETRLRDIHLTEFAVVGDVAYAFGDCGKGSGVAAVFLDGSGARLVNRSACGTVGAVADDATLVLGRRWSRDPYGRGQSASLVFVDVDAGRIDRSLELPADPADVLAVG